MCSGLNVRICKAKLEGVSTRTGIGMGGQQRLACEVAVINQIDRELVGVVLEAEATNVLQSFKSCEHV